MELAFRAERPEANARMIDSTNTPTNKGSRGDCVFAADLGGTHLRASTISEDGHIHFRKKQNTPRAESADEIVSAIVRSTCGSRGCLEVYASATAIVRMTREARPRY